MLKSFFQGILASFISVVLLLTAFLLFAFYIYQTIAPRPELFAYPSMPESTKIYARDGTLIYEIYKEAKRTPVPLTEINISFKNAIIAIEDKNFYTHAGVSINGIGRSVLQNVSSGEIVSGGSTITQQVIKNVLQPKQKTLARKLSEAVWAFSLEQHYSKDKILEIYVNSIPFGRNAYGIEAAAQSYFGKKAVDLTVAQSAYLAAMPKAPFIYNPDSVNGRDKLEQRKNVVLSEMFKDGYITEQEFTLAKNEQVTFNSARGVLMAPHFVLWLKQELISKYGQHYVETGGLKVYTTLDLTMQGAAEEAVRKYETINAKKYNANNAGLVAIDPKTGQILAMVGSKNYFAESQYCKNNSCLFDPNTNIATAKLQPGSSFKPYVYVTAFSPKFGFNTGSIVLDVARNFSQNSGGYYSPKNYNGLQYGKVTLRKALAGSLNIATVNLAAELSTDEIIKTVNSLGIKNNFKNCGLVIALGGCEVTLLEHVGAFSTFANNGLYNPYTPILKITDKYGKLVDSYVGEAKQVIDEQANFELVSILSDNNARAFIFGKNNPLTLPDRSVIAKTGTTQNWKDGWTVGGTTDVVAGVWVGNSNGALMAKGADGVIVAAPIWQNFMKNINQNLLAKEFKKPTGVVEVKVNPKTGFLDARGEKFSMEFAASFSLPKEPEIKIIPKILEQDLVFTNAKIIQPENGQVVNLGDIEVSALAETGYGTIASLYIDGQLINDAQAPNFSWKIPSIYLTSGEHKLSLKAVNQAGYQSEDSVTITVSGGLASLLP